MSNRGKFIDRCPIICAAGKPSRPNVSMKETLKDYKLADGIDALKNDFGIRDKIVIPDTRKIIPEVKVNNLRRGIHDRILEHISHPKKTYYQELMNDIKETTYHSYWNKCLGKVADPTPGLPIGMNIEETVFGKKPEEKVSAYEIIFPNITRYEVLWNSQINHENYKKYLHDYNVGERIDRNYSKPPYNPDAYAGYKTKCRDGGSRLRHLMKWPESEQTVRSKREVDYMERHRIKLGKVHSPNEVPQDSLRCPTKKDLHGVAELLKPGCEPAFYKKETLKRLASLNSFRQLLKKRFSPTFTMKDFYDRFAFHDKNSTKFISLENFYSVIAHLNIPTNRDNLKALFEDLGIIQSGNINYGEFVEVIKYGTDLDKQLDPLPKEKLNYCSESSAAALDRYFCDNSLKPAAGTMPPIKYCPWYYDTLPTDNVKSLMEWSIFLQYNISYKDMFQKREKEFIKTLFTKCGFQFSEGAFDELYQLALNQDQTGGVCVDTFYKILKKYQGPVKKIVDELESIPDQCKYFKRF